MAKTKSPYPNLDRYMKHSGLGATARMVLLGVVIGITVPYVPQGLWWVVVVAILAFQILYFVAMLLIQGRAKSAERFQQSIRRGLPGRIRSLIKKGRLEETITKEGADVLEACARHCIAMQTDVFRSAMLVTDKRLSREATKELLTSMRGAMNNAVDCFQSVFMMPGPATRIDIARAQEIEGELAQLEDEVAKWAEAVRSKPEKVDLSPLRRRLQTMREFETSVKSGEVVLGDVDLEHEAKKRLSE